MQCTSKSPKVIDDLWKCAVNYVVQAKNALIVFCRFLYIGWTNRAEIFTGDLFGIVLENSDVGFTTFLPITRVYISFKLGFLFEARLPMLFGRGTSKNRFSS